MPRGWGWSSGADAVKIKYTGDPQTFSWAVKSAGKALVYMSGGPKAPTDQDFLNQVRGVMQSGATGLAVGRNVWQNDDPVRMANYLRQVIFEKKTVESVIKA